MCGSLTLPTLGAARFATLGSATVTHGMVTKSVGDSTPGGSSDVWLWEADLGLQWETDTFMTTE